MGFKGVSLCGCRLLLSQLQGVESDDVMLAVCLCVHPHCVTQVYRLDNKHNVCVCSLPLAGCGHESGCSRDCIITPLR